MAAMSSWCLWLLVICSLIWSIFGIKASREYAMTCPEISVEYYPGYFYPVYIEAFIEFNNDEETFSITIKDAKSYALNQIAIGFSIDGFFTDFNDASDGHASAVISSPAYAIVLTYTADSSQDSGFSYSYNEIGFSMVDGQVIGTTRNLETPNSIDRSWSDNGNDFVITRSYQDAASLAGDDIYGITFEDNGANYASGYVDWFCHFSESSEIVWGNSDDTVGYSYGQLIIDDNAMDATLTSASGLTPWFFVIDVSPSMDDDIAAIRELIIDLVDTDERKKYFLTLYQNDPQDEDWALFKTQTKTFFSLKAFKHEISYNVRMQLGFRCEESTIAGILACLGAAGNVLGEEDYANVFVFSDASTREDGAETGQAVLTYLEDMVGHIRIHFILTAELCSLTGMDSNYQDVAEGTDGVIMWTDTSDAIDANQVVFNIEPILVSDNIQTIVAVSFNSTYFEQTFTVSGGSSISTLYIHISCGFQERVSICSFQKDNIDIDEASYTVNGSNINSGYKTIQISGDDIGGIGGEYSLSFALDSGSCLRGRGRNLLQTSNNSNRKLTIYLIDATILIDYSVKNVNNNDINDIADTTMGYVNYDEDGSFAVIVTPSNDESNDNIHSMDTITIISGDGLASISQNAILLSTLGANNKYYALFEFVDLDNIGLNEFKIKVMGTDINGIQFIRQSSTTTHVSYLTAVLECDGEGANNNLIFIGSQMLCSLTITRQDTSSDTSIDLTVTSNNAFLNANDLLTYTFDNSILSFAIGVATITTSLTVSIDEANSNAIDETFRLTVNAYESSNDAYIYARDGIFKIVNDWCPVACDNINVIDGLDICDCSEITNCVASACHENGCNQCENGYFKKDYNYNCENCNDLFGDNCLFCQDFEGCGQCKLGSIKTLDADCGMYYCLSNSDNGNFVDGSTICEQIGQECDETTIADCGGQCICDGGTWKLDVNTECVSCHDIFGDACLFCQDFHGCGQCDVGYNRVQTDECGDFTIWKCELE